MRSIIKSTFAVGVTSLSKNLLTMYGTSRTKIMVVTIIILTLSEREICVWRAKSSSVHSKIFRSLHFSIRHPDKVVSSRGQRVVYIPTYTFTKSYERKIDERFH